MDFVEELRLQRAQLAEAQAVAHIGSWEWDIAADRITWSDELYRIYGIDPEGFEASYEAFRSLVHPEDREMVDAAVAAAHASGEPFSFVHRIVRPDGEVRELHGRGRVIAGPDGRPVRMVGTGQDITEQRRQERELVSQKEFSEELIEASDDGIVAVDRDIRYTAWNRAMERITGVPREQALGRSPFEVLPFLDEIGEREIVARVLAGESVRAPERSYALPTGRAGYFEGRYTPLRDATGEVSGILSIVRDTTARREAEERFRRSRETLQALLDHSPALIVVKDLEGHYLLVNRAALEMRGVNHEDIAGKTAHEIFPPDWAEAFDRIDRELLERGEPIRREVTVEMDGQPHTFLVNRFLLSGGSGEPYAIGSISADITERVRIERENTRLAAELHHAQRMESVGQLAGGVAHDFNNLLAVVLSYSTYALARMGPSDPLREVMDEIRRAAEHGASLTRQLLAFSRREVARPEPLDVHAVLDRTQGLLRRTLGDHVDLGIAGDAEVPTVMVDPRQLEQVLVNLAVNARDAMPGGGTVTISAGSTEIGADRLRAHPGTSAGTFVRVCVADDGSGMREAVAARAFEPFFTTKQAGHGTGLGLATVHGIITEAGGFVEIETAPDRGTTVSIYLPAAEPQEVLREATDSRPSEIPASARILVVEDDPGVRGTAHAILTAAGHSVVGAEGPSEALDAWDRTRADLVLTDVMMPAMSGRELVGRLRERAPELRVILMSGHHRELESASGETTLQKPFTAEALESAVATALERPPDPAR